MLLPKLLYLVCRGLQAPSSEVQKNEKLFCVLLIIFTLCSLAAGGSENEKDSNSSAKNSTPNISASIQNADNFEVDLTNLSSTMVYSEVYNMMSTPASYIGKTVSKLL